MNRNPVSRKGRPTGRMAEKLAAILERDLFREIIDDLPLLDTAKQIEVKLKLMEFVMPKRKAVEHSGEIDTSDADRDAAIKQAVETMAKIEADKREAELQAQAKVVRIASA